MKKEPPKAHSPQTQGGSSNLSRMMPVVYDELRRLARLYMRREKAGQTLQATALVNEAYLRLMKEKAHGWKNRAHFCAIAANSMREILVERARSRAAQKRRGSRIRLSLDEAMLTEQSKPLDLLTLDEALERLAVFDPRLARIVELRFFGGLNIEELAQEMELSPATIKRSWAMAKAWLKSEMEKAHGS
jgi:RNA polymerase sigma-70 factor (ECF subfamily)